MNLFSNKKINILLLSIGLLILIVLLLFPDIFVKRVSFKVMKSPEITKIQTQSNDTSLDSIKKDLDSTDVSNLDKELQNIDKEINAEN